MHTRITYPNSNQCSLGAYLLSAMVIKFATQCHTGREETPIRVTWRNSHPGFPAKLKSGIPCGSPHHGISKPCNTVPHCGSDGNAHPGTLAKLTSWRNSHPGSLDTKVKAMVNTATQCHTVGGQEMHIRVTWRSLHPGTLTNLTSGLPGETQVRNPLWFTTPWLVPVNPAILPHTVAVTETYIRVPWRNSHRGETHIVAKLTSWRNSHLGSFIAQVQAMVNTPTKGNTVAGRETYIWVTWRNSHLVP